MSDEPILDRCSLVLLDGLNLMIGAGRRARRGTGSPRRRFLRWLARHPVLEHARIIVVYDGPADPRDPAVPPRRARRRTVRHAGTQPADELILELTLAATRKQTPETVVVVTDDRELALRCSYHGARTLDGRSFIAAARDRAAGAWPAEGETEQELDPEAAARITEELRRHWSE